MVRKALVGGVAALAMVAWMAAPASAGAPPMTINKTSGPPGTVVQVSSPTDECGGSPVEVVLVADQDGADPIVTLDFNSLDASPDWIVNLTVPSDAAPGAYLVEATCHYNVEETFSYQTQDFTVTEPATTTTTSTTTTTVAVQAASSTTTTTTVAPVAPAATPVVASPALTG